MTARKRSYIIYIESRKSRAIQKLIFDSGLVVCSMVCAKVHSSQHSTTCRCDIMFWYDSATNNSKLQDVHCYHFVEKKYLNKNDKTLHRLTPSPEWSRRTLTSPCQTFTLNCGCKLRHHIDYLGINLNTIDNTSFCSGHLRYCGWHGLDGFSPSNI